MKPRGLVGGNLPKFRAPRPRRLVNSPDGEVLRPDRQSPCSYRGTTSWSYDVQSCSRFRDRQRSSTSWRCRPRTCWTRGTTTAEECTYFELVSIVVCRYWQKCSGQRQACRYANHCNSIHCHDSMPNIPEDWSLLILPWKIRFHATEHKWRWKETPAEQLVYQ